MSIRTALSFVLAIGLFVLPPAAEAGQIKGPMWITMRADNVARGTSHAGIGVYFDPIGGRPKGQYILYFPREVASCAASGTTSEGWAGVVGVAVGTPSADLVTVFTMDPA